MLNSSPNGHGCPHTFGHIVQIPVRSLFLCLVLILKWKGQNLPSWQFIHFYVMSIRKKWTVSDTTLECFIYHTFVFWVLFPLEGRVSTVLFRFRSDLFRCYLNLNSSQIPKKYRKNTYSYLGSVMVVILPLYLKLNPAIVLRQNK